MSAILKAGVIGTGVFGGYHAKKYAEMDGIQLMGLYDTHPERCYAMAEQLGVDLAELSLDEMQALDPRITEGVYSVLTPAASAASRTSYGGTAPTEVRRQIARWKEILR